MDISKIEALEETLDHIQKVLQRIRELTETTDSSLLMSFLDVTLCREVEILHKIINNKWTLEDYEQYNHITQNYMDACSGGVESNAIRMEVEKLYRK